MDGIAKNLVTQRPQEVYSAHINTDDISEAPCDSRNKKAAIGQAQKIVAGKATCHNFGDEMQQMPNMCQTDDFV